MKLLILSVLCIFVVNAKIEHVKEKASETHANPKKVEVKDAPEHKVSREKFMEDLRFRRVQHADAIRGLKIVSDDKINGFLDDVVKNIQKILNEHRDIIGRITIIEKSQIPDEEKNQDSLLKVLENAAFFADLSLAYPKYFEKILKKNLKLKTLIVWAYHYSTKTELFDEATSKQVMKMAQKYGIIEKSKKEQEKDDLEKKSEEKIKKRKEEKEKQRKPEKKQPKGEL